MAQRISPQQGLQTLLQGEALFVDVRDPASHAQARIPGALPLAQGSLERFLAATRRDQPLVVYCYHGHSSQAASDYLSEQGFTVFSLDGGFEHWRQAFPEQVDDHPLTPP
jgi:thiosulfate sulfurtransferase